jgi:hypothetical protein
LNETHQPAASGKRRDQPSRNLVVNLSPPNAVPDDRDDGEVGRLEKADVRLIGDGERGSAKVAGSV